jgi:hypothetical protein
MVIGEPNARVTVLVASQRNLRVTTRLLQLRPQTSRAYGKPAGLRYVSGGKPGITRLRARGGFGYRGPEGSKVSDDAIPLASHLGGSTHVVDATRENSLRSLALVAA